MTGTAWALVTDRWMLLSPVHPDHSLLEIYSLVLRLHLQAFRLRLADLNRPAAASYLRLSDPENH